MKLDIGPVKAERPFYTHKCICGTVVGMSDLLFSPAATSHLPCLHCVANEREDEEAWWGV